MISSSGGENYYRRKGFFDERIPFVTRRCDLFRAHSFSVRHSAALLRISAGAEFRDSVGVETKCDRDILPRAVISRKLSVPNAEHIFLIRHALRAGFIEEIFNLAKISRSSLAASIGSKATRNSTNGP